MDGKSWRENGLRLRRKPNREVEASSRRVLFCAPEPARRPLSADNRARLHRIALAIEANGRRPLDRRRPEDGLHRRPARLPSQAHELIGRRRADALEDLSGRGASGRPVSFTTVSPGSRACSVRGPSEDRREHRKDSSLLMRSSSQNRQARTADGRCQEPGGARVRVAPHLVKEACEKRWLLRITTTKDPSGNKIRH